jgi:hypothetical protein
MSDHYQRQAQISLQSYVQTVHALLTNTIPRPDLLLAAGDSGQAVMYITKLVYQELNLSLPPLLILPVYRQADEARIIPFDNSILANELKGANIESLLQRIVFLDDEIGNGMVAWAVLQLVHLAKLPLARRAEFLIIAEDGGFPGIRDVALKVTLRSPRLRATDMYNAIAYNVPDRYAAPVESVLNNKIKHLNKKQVMCILLGLPIKDINKGMPTYSHAYNKLVMTNVPGFQKLQNGYQAFLRQKVAKILKAATVAASQ